MASPNESERSAVLTFPSGNEARLGGDLGGPGPGDLGRRDGEAGNVTEVVFADDSVAIEPSFHGDEASLVLCGEIDALVVPLLRRALTALLSHRPPILVFDLSGATFLSLAAIRLLVVAEHHAREVCWYKPTPTTARVAGLVRHPRSECCQAGGGPVWRTPR